MELLINILCEISDEQIRKDIQHILEKMLPYMCDNVLVTTETSKMNPSIILDRLASDPDDYNNVDNRAQAHLINRMRQCGFWDGEIYKVCNLLIDAYAAARKDRE